LKGRRSFISNVERGVMLPSLAMLLRLADVLERDFTELVRVFDCSRRTSPMSRKG